MLCNEATLSAVFTCGMAQRRWQGSWRCDWSERENCRLKIEKGATAAPLFLTGEVSLAFLAGLLLPALGFLCHCLLSPPSSGICLPERLRYRGSGCRLARSLDLGHSTLEVGFHLILLTRDGLSSPSSYQM